MCNEMSEGEYQAYQDLERPPAPTKTTWVTRDGREVPVAKMTDSHLINTVRFLRRGCAMRMWAELFPMFRYMEHAPDGAYDAVESEVHTIMSWSDDYYLSSRVPTFRRMLDEIKKRKLAA